MLVVHFLAAERWRESTGNDHVFIATIQPMLVVLVEQVGAVDASRLTELVGHVDPAEMWGIDEALLTVLDLR